MTWSKYTGSDGKTVLDTSDDAVTVNWGSPWRMPTRNEFEELINNCTWTWTTVNKVEGYMVTGNNGNSIFLPAAGYYDGPSLYRMGMGGYYLSSSLNTDCPAQACYLFFYSAYYVWSGNFRYYGQSVRPVCP